MTSSIANIVAMVAFLSKPICGIDISHTLLYNTKSTGRDTTSGIRFAYVFTIFNGVVMRDF